MVHLGDKRFGVLMVALVPAAIALRLAWGLHGPGAFGLGFEARAQEETEDCSNVQIIEEFTGMGNQRTETFETITDSFLITYQLTAAGDPNSSLNVTLLDSDGSPTVEAVQGGGEGIGETLISEPPGTYSLDITATGSAEYTVTVEECGNAGSQKQMVAQTRTAAQQTDNPGGQDRSSPTQENIPQDRSTDQDRSRGRGELLEAGGPQESPAPVMPDGNCPA